MENTFYITTPIYYPSDKLHIGHSYTTVAADTMARYKKLRGYDVKFLTGTDEHGQKIERKAKLSGITPQQYVDNIVMWIKELWKTLDIEYDYFLRTTDSHHEKAVQKIFKKLYDNGDIYKSKYSGLYCTPCETFFTDRQLNDGKCPDCGRAVETVDEESYFFRLSKYQQPLIDYIESHPDFISPKTRQNEMVNNFIKPGLEDLCVSRTSFTWGVPVEFDPGHVVYVWIDALSNYITALGYLSDNDTDYKKYWPADIHLVGKEIVRFHTIIWPAMLLALGEPLPKQVFGHGWLIIDGGKMSKSKGNVVDPKYLVDRYGVDSIRYFLMREVAFGQDGNFTNESLLQRINSDLANDLGNLVSRTSSMIEKYFEGQLPEEKQPFSEENDNSLINLAKNTVSEYTAAMDKLLFSDALTHIWALIRRTNKYIDETSPWILAKDESKRPVLCGVMYNLAESLRIVSILISPFMPNTAKKIISEFSFSGDIVSFDSTQNWGMSKNIKIVKGGIIFPRIDISKELEVLAETLGNKTEKKEEQKEPAKEPTVDNLISIDEFDKIELKVGQVIACEKIKGSDKLLKSQIKIGEETRQIVSGIAKYYTPEEMTGKSVVVVTNLKPVKLKGEMSYGMILAAQNADGKLTVINADGAESGAGVS